MLTGWRLHDTSRHRYTFGTFTLCGGCHVNVHTGSGGNTAKNRFWGSGAYIWNNTGDKATLVSPAAASSIPAVGDQPTQLQEVLKAASEGTGGAAGGADGL